MNTLYKDHKLYKGDKGTSFMVDNGLHFRICAEGCKFKIIQTCIMPYTNWN